MSDDEIDGDDLDDFEVIACPEEVPASNSDGYLVISYHDFVPPVEFPNIWRYTNVNELKIFTNFLSETVPERLSTLSSLQKLVLSCSASQQGKGISHLPSEFGNLPNLTSLDLCGNQFRDFPSCICNLKKLEKLYLNGCGLTSIPSSIADLENLKELDLSSNGLNILPQELFSLANIENLYLNNCKLEELPPAIANMRKLVGLRVMKNMLKSFPEEFYELESLIKLVASHNEIRVLSPNLMQLKSLKILCLNKNNLKQLPKEIGNLSNLKYLDLSDNMLTSIPQEITKLSSKDFSFHIEGNYTLQVPPLGVCQCGLESVFAFYESKQADDSKCIHSKRLKIVLLGESGAGKSSLAYALEHGSAPNILPDDRTVGIEFFSWKPNPEDPNGLKFEILDCAGQRRYHLTHPFFLSEGALHMLVVNISRYKCTPESFKEMVSDWLDLVIARISQPVVMVVPTHIDECSDASGAIDKDLVTSKCSDILDRTKEWQKQNMAWLEKEVKSRKKSNKRSLAADENEECQILEKLRRRKNHPLIISSVLWFKESLAGASERPKIKTKTIAMVPVSNKEGLIGLRNLRHAIQHSAEDKELFPWVGEDLPEKWLALEEKIIQYRQKIKFPCVTAEEFSNFAETQCQLGHRALSGAVEYLDSIGQLKYYSQTPVLNKNVALDLKWLAMMMKLLFRHDLESNFQYKMEYFEKFSVAEDDFNREKIWLFSKAVLSLQLLSCIWMEMELNPHQIQQMVLIMEHFGLACELQADPSNVAPTVSSSESPLLLVPWFLPQKCDQELMSDWPDKPADESQVEVKLKFVVSYLPWGLFDRLRVRCHCIANEYANWYNGMRLSIKDIDILVCVCESKQPSIVITGRNEKDKLNELWESLLLIVRETEHLLKEWKGINYKRYTVCPHCVKKDEKTPYVFPCNWLGASQNHPGDHIERCKAGRKWNRVQVDLVLPPADVVRRFERDSRLLNNAPVSDEVSDDLFSELSRRLPKSWKSVAIKLGLTNNDVEIIECNYRDVTEQTMKVLCQWKQEKGSAATRNSLIKALVAAKCTEQAEFVHGYKV